MPTTLVDLTQQSTPQPAFFNDIWQSNSKTALEMSLTKTITGTSIKQFPYIDHDLLHQTCVFPAFITEYWKSSVNKLIPFLFLEHLLRPTFSYTITACSVLSVSLYNKFSSDYEDYTEKTGCVIMDEEQHASSSRIRPCVVVAVKKVHQGSVHSTRTFRFTRHVILLNITIFQTSCWAGTWKIMPLLSRP